jgi:8-oxo-dGTP pyrophosphatase MutT (NUDIX family)
MRSGDEVAIFVTRRHRTQVLIVHRSPVQGSYWHVVAGGVEPGETAEQAAARELKEETGLDATPLASRQAVEYLSPLTEEPADRRARYDASVAEVHVTCFVADAPDDWEPELDWEHDDHRWCSPEEAATTLRWPDTARALAESLAPPETGL